MSVADAEERDTKGVRAGTAEDTLSGPHPGARQLGTGRGGTFRAGPASRFAPITIDAAAAAH